MAWKKLTTPNGSLVAINVAMAISITESRERSGFYTIRFPGGSLQDVREKPEEILKHEEVWS